MRGVWGAAVAAVVASLLVGCAPGSTTGAPPSAAPTVDAEVTFVSVVDGDTIETSAGTVPHHRDRRTGDRRVRVRRSISARFFPSQPRRPDDPDPSRGENDADQYGRILRYVDTTQGLDVALSLLTAGLAVARYDSTDAYPAHPREAGYHAAQLATLSADAAVTTVAVQSDR